jgi:hypothetical protein
MASQKLIYLKIPNERLNMGSCSADRSAGRFGIVKDRQSGFQPNSYIRRDTFPKKNIFCHFKEALLLRRATLQGQSFRMQDLFRTFSKNGLAKNMRNVQSREEGIVL